MKRCRKFTMMGFALALSTGALAAEVAVQDTFEATFVKSLATADMVVLRTSDGTEHRVRLFGVASPLADQPYAGAAESFLAKLVGQGLVKVEVVAEDADGVPVGRITMADGSTINERIIQEGFAWWDEINAPDAGPWKKRAAEAIVAGKGLWKDSAPLAPWDYRTSHQLPPVRYEAKAEALEAMEEDLEAVEPKTPTIEAKGTAKPGLPAGLPAGLPVAPEEYLSLAAKHQPHIARDGQGKSLGLTASDIGGIPGASQVGFQNGDIVQSVNGITLTSEAQIFGLVSQLQGAKALKLVVIRGGKPVTLNIPL